MADLASRYLIFMGPIMGSSKFCVLILAIDGQTDEQTHRVKPLNKQASTVWWRFSLVVTRLDQRSYSTLGPISAGMGDFGRTSKLSLYVTSHQGQLNLTIPPWVGVLSTSLSWEGNRRSGVSLAMRHAYD